MTDRELRIVVLRMCRQYNDTDLARIKDVSGERELTIRGVLAEMVQHGFLKRPKDPRTPRDRKIWLFTDLAKYTIDLLEPREGRHR